MKIVFLSKTNVRNILMIGAVAFTAMFAGTTFTGCKGSKKLPSVQEGSTRISVPLSGKEYKSDKDYFRATQSGNSIDLATAKKIALQNARTELASGVQSTVKAVTANYTNQRTVGDRQEFTNKFEEESRTVINQSLNDVKIIGEEVYKEPNGKITYYIAIEMSKEIVVKGMNDRISKDAKLQLDYDQYRFRQLFDEEMKKFENQ